MSQNACPLITDMFSGVDITSQEIAYNFAVGTIPRDGLYYVHINVTGLDSAGATLEAWLLQRTGAKNQYLGEYKSIDTTIVPQKEEAHIILGPVFVIEGKYLRVLLKSSNANDTSVNGTVYLIDHHARSYHNSSTDIPEVDSGLVSGESPKTADEIGDTTAAKILDTPANLLETDAQGRIDLGKINGDADIVPLLIKAVQVLANKAIQNKSTGTIVYYDDDGETPV